MQDRTLVNLLMLVWEKGVTGGAECICSMLC